MQELQENQVPCDSFLLKWKESHGFLHFLYLFKVNFALFSLKNELCSIFQWFFHAIAWIRFAPIYLAPKDQIRPD